MPSSFRDLRVWQESIELTTDVYRETARFPKHETYGLVQQIRRAAVSIASNIAEGKGHRSDRRVSSLPFPCSGVSARGADSIGDCGEAWLSFRTRTRSGKPGGRGWSRSEWTNILAGTKGSLDVLDVAYDVRPTTYDVFPSPSTAPQRFRLCRTWPRAESRPSRS